MFLSQKKNYKYIKHYNNYNNNSNNYNTYNNNNNIDDCEQAFADRCGRGKKKNILNLDKNSFGY